MGSLHRVFAYWPNVFWIIGWSYQTDNNKLWELLPLICRYCFIVQLFHCATPNVKGPFVTHPFCVWMKVPRSRNCQSQVREMLLRDGEEQRGQLSSSLFCSLFTTLQTYPQQLSLIVSSSNICYLCS